jgi:hypothetical protein
VESFRREHDCDLPVFDSWHLWNPEIVDRKEKNINYHCPMDVSLLKGFTM